VFLVASGGRGQQVTARINAGFTLQLHARELQLTYANDQVLVVPSELELQPRYLPLDSVKAFSSFAYGLANAWMTIVWIVVFQDLAPNCRAFYQPATPHKRLGDVVAVRRPGQQLLGLFESALAAFVVASLAGFLAKFAQGLKLLNLLL
jgi:hypothetical protein